MKEKESISITLNKVQIEELDQITKATGIKRSTLVQQAVDIIVNKYKKQLALLVNS